jgi:hypothetical protein
VASPAQRAAARVIPEPIYFDDRRKLPAGAVLHMRRQAFLSVRRAADVLLEELPDDDRADLRTADERLLASLHDHLEQLVGSFWELRQLAWFDVDGDPRQGGA